jgi:hypothetical protein
MTTPQLRVHGGQIAQRFVRANRGALERLLQLVPSTAGARPAEWRGDQRLEAHCRSFDSHLDGISWRRVSGAERRRIVCNGST